MVIRADEVRQHREVILTVSRADDQWDLFDRLDQFVRVWQAMNQIHSTDDQRLHLAGPQFGDELSKVALVPLLLETETLYINR